MPENGAVDAIVEALSPETPEPPKKECTYEECDKNAVWSFTMQVPAGPDAPPHIHQDYFCHEHAMSIIVLYASTETNEFKPMFMQAWPIRLGGQFHPIGIFVCSVGHIGRCSVQKTGKVDGDKVQYALIANYRPCNSCDALAQEIMAGANEMLFGSKGKVVYKKYRNRDKDVA